MRLQNIVPVPIDVQPWAPVVRPGGYVHLVDHDKYWSIAFDADKHRVHGRLPPT
jgi:hypothetical protein